MSSHKVDKYAKRRDNGVFEGFHHQIPPSPQIERIIHEELPK